jgi:asparagine synthase (glutamine-hydrolysing)
LGADELLGGYPSFRDVALARRWLRLGQLAPGFGKAVRMALAGSLPSLAPRSSPKLAGLLEYGGSWAGAWLLRRGVFMPWELPDLLGSDLAEEGLRRLRPLARIEQVLQPFPGDPFSAVSVLETSLYMRNQLLRDTDWAGMAHGVEIRVPYVDVGLVKAIPAGSVLGRVRAKRLLGEVPERGLPAQVKSRPKTGFSIPLQKWILGQDNEQRLAASSRQWTRRVWSLRNWATA